MEQVFKSRLRAVLSMFFSIGLISLNLFAQLPSTTIQDLVTESEIVAIGMVSEIQSRWTDDRSRIISYVTIDIEEYIKGERVERTITVMQLGGEVDGIGELYSHTARFVEDEEVAVFLREDRAGNLRVTGGDRGKFSVTRDETRDIKMVGEHQTLDGFRSRVRNIIEEEIR